MLLASLTTHGHKLNGAIKKRKRKHEFKNARMTLFPRDLIFVKEKKNDKKVWTFA